MSVNSVTLLNGMAEQIPLAFEFRANQTFKDFFAGSNQEVVTHLYQCIQSQSEPQIYIWGTPGLGKTHLLQACCQQSYQYGLSAFYFAFSESLPDPVLLTGLEKYDVVCFDNIDAIAGDQNWELAFFNFYNEQRSLSHKLIITANKPPDQLGIQLQDLKTRLSWGLTLKLKPLQDEEKIAALMFRAEQMGFEVSPQAGRFLLTHLNRDMASLWALLEKLDKASLAAQRKLTIPFLKQTLLSK